MVSPADQRTVFFLASTLIVGGAEKVIKALVLGLPEHGYRPHILCLHGLGPIGRELSQRGVTVHFGLMHTRLDPGALVRLFRIFRRERDAILYVLDHHDALFVGSVASRAAGLRRRVTPVHSTGLWGGRNTFSRIDRLVLSSYDRVIALSPGHAEYIRRHGGIEPVRIAVINNGVDTGRFRPAGSPGRRRRIRESIGIPADIFTVTIVAALRPEKNHRMFLKAAAAFRAGGGRGLFLIVGGGREAENLHALARELALEDTVRFLGPREDVPEILAASDLSVLCSHPIVETFPLSVLESMAAGVPVVVTAVGSIPEMVEDGVQGLVVGPGDVGALVGALRLLERDPERRGAMGERAREHVVDNFSERRMIDEYVTLFGGLPGAGVKGDA